MPFLEQTFTQNMESDGHLERVFKRCILGAAVTSVLAEMLSSSFIRSFIERVQEEDGSQLALLRVLRCVPVLPDFVKTNEKKTSLLQDLNFIDI